ncbi:MAG TPA: hypothetical protein VLY04_14900 [Bryobacteraceae bacterium]|nr:hypothetical protein [Bryobacteraceae bacterium]
MKPLLAVLLALPLWSQSFSQRGFFETDTTLYPQTAPNDSSHAVVEGLLRYEAFYHFTGSLTLAGGIDARTDTHLETARQFGLSWWDRERQRPAFEVRRLSLTYTRGKLTFEAGKQLIRWGKADILNPTDRFAPRDFLNVVNTEFLGITAARLTYGNQSNSIDLVFSPRLTPSRVPLLDQRWSGMPAGIAITELPPALPGGPQFGARWSHIGAVAEYSLSFYNGYDHLPLVRSGFAAGFTFERYYPPLRTYGADAAVPLGPITVKAETAYFTSTSPLADHYLLGVLQLERQSGEWSFVGGYAAQAITEHGLLPAFSPDRGFTRAILGRAGYTIDVNRSLAFEAVVRQNGQGLWLKPEYSQAFGQHWRVTAGFAWIHGSDSDFLGQFHRNSYGILTVRYSF